MSLIVHCKEGLYGDQRTEFGYTKTAKIWKNESKLHLSPSGRVAFAVLGQHENGLEQIKLFFKLAELYLEADVFGKPKEIKINIEKQMEELHFALNDTIIFAISNAETLYYNGSHSKKPKLLDSACVIPHGTGEGIFMMCYRDGFPIKNCLAISAKHTPTVGKVFNFISRESLRPFITGKVKQKHQSLKNKLETRKTK